MQFQRTPKILLRSEERKFSNDKLSLYVDPPDEEISLVEVEQLLVQRLHVLKTLEQLKERFQFLSAQFKTEFEKAVINVQPLFIGKCSTSKVAEYQRADEISHFLLRLACCMDHDHTLWFINQEVDLLKLRIHYVGSASLIDYISKRGRSQIEVVSNEEKHRLIDSLSNGNFLSHVEVESRTFYKVPFTDCRDLIRSMRVFLNNGFCYVTNQRLNLAQLNEEDRVLALMYKVVYAGNSEKTESDGTEINVDQVDELASTSFPLCMRGIHNRLRAEHHLKFFARQQYGLFLKGAGLSMEGSIAFFRQEFTKRMDLDKFNKQYLYNIRHMYGKEGNRADHKPMGCAQIILNNAPATGDCHGCPFKHNDPKTLSQRLSALRLNENKKNEIMKLASDHRYDFACTRTFEYTHGLKEGELGRVITRPNDYLDYSRTYKQHKAPKAE